MHNYLQGTKVGSASEDPGSLPLAFVKGDNSPGGKTWPVSLKDAKQEEGVENKSLFLTSTEPQQHTMCVLL